MRHRLQVLNEEFNAALQYLKPPSFPGPLQASVIDPVTYLPVYSGRRFDELSSQGLMVMVNVAHVLAHQRAALRLGLRLPNILLIDGLTSNIGHHEGMDQERWRRIYDYIIETGREFPDLQFIVADNDVPDDARDYISVEFSEDEKLAPFGALVQADTDD